MYHYFKKWVSGISVGRDPSLLPATSASIVSLCSKDSKDSESTSSNIKNIECTFNSMKNLHTKSDTLTPMGSKQTNSSSEPEITQMCTQNVSHTKFSHYNDVNIEPMQLQEPDVIASTKNNHKNKDKDKDNNLPGPVAPPRKKKKHRTASLSNEDRMYNDRVKKDSKNSLNVEVCVIQYINP